MIKKAYAILFAVVFFLVSLVNVAVSGVTFMYQKSTLTPASYNAENFTLNALAEKDNGVYVATDSDPYMTITLDRAVKKVEFSADYYVSPGEIVLFYTTSPEQDFSYANYCVAHTDSNGDYQFDLDGKYVHRIRIDPTDIGGNRISFGRITINDNITMADYFSLSVLIFLKLFIITSIISRIICFVFE